MNFYIVFRQNNSLKLISVIYHCATSLCLSKLGKALIKNNRYFLCTTPKSTTTWRAPPPPHPSISLYPSAPASNFLCLYLLRPSAPPPTLAASSPASLAYHRPVLRAGCIEQGSKTSRQSTKSSALCASQHTPSIVCCYCRRFCQHQQAARPTLTVSVCVNIDAAAVFTPR